MDFNYNYNGFIDYNKYTIRHHKKRYWLEVWKTVYYFCDLFMNLKLFCKINFILKKEVIRDPVIGKRVNEPRLSTK